MGKTVLIMKDLISGAKWVGGVLNLGREMKTSGLYQPLCSSASLPSSRRGVGGNFVFIPMCLKFDVSQVMLFCY